MSSGHFLKMKEGQKCKSPDVVNIGFNIYAEHSPANCISGDDIRRMMLAPIPKRETGNILVETDHGVWEMAKSELRYLKPDEVSILLKESERLMNERENEKQKDSENDDAPPPGGAKINK